MLGKCYMQVWSEENQNSRPEFWKMFKDERLLHIMLPRACFLL